MYSTKAREDGTEGLYGNLSGMFLVNTLPTKILFDAGATHYFINPATVKRLACQLDKMDVQ